MTVRNIRSHASRGLLPPPEVRARTGYYGPEHVARLKLILELQAAGHSLAGIKHLLSQTNGIDAEDVLGFARSVLAPYESETPEIVDESELTERFGTDAKVREKAVRLGLIVPLGQGRFEVPSPALLHAGELLQQLGVGPARSLALLESISRSADSIAEQFVKLFLERFWTADADLGDVQKAVDQLRPVATEAVVALFHQRMTRRTEKAFSRALERK